MSALPRKRIVKFCTRCLRGMTPCLWQRVLTIEVRSCSSLIQKVIQQISLLCEIYAPRWHVGMKSGLLLELEDNEHRLPTPIRNLRHNHISGRRAALLQNSLNNLHRCGANRKLRP